MSQSSTSDDKALPSGTYVIHSAQDSKDDERTVMVADDKSQEVMTEKDQIFKWIVTYYPDDDNYTIEEAGEAQYVITKGDTASEKVYTAKDSQRFKILPVTYKNTVYYGIMNSDADVFRCQGNNQQVVAVKSLLASPSVLWDFEECSPYTLSSLTNTYFESDFEGKLLSRFGLNSKFTWVQLWNAIDKLNADAKGSAFYKVIFLGRHGHDEHNIKKQLGPDYEGFDAELTQRGCVQAGLVRAVWDSARSEKDGIGLPQLSFCSPMRRAMVTNTITFSSELSDLKPPTPLMKTMVVENCRERMYTDNSEHRHSKNWIQQMFYNFAIEDGFTDNDELWDPDQEETFPRFRERGRNILDRIFAPNNASVRFVSITAHHEWSAMFMEVLGQPGAMDNFRLEEGGVLPVIVEYIPPAN